MPPTITRRVLSLSPVPAEANSRQFFLLPLLILYTPQREKAGGKLLFSYK